MVAVLERPRWVVFKFVCAIKVVLERVDERKRRFTRVRGVCLWVLVSSSGVCSFSLGRLFSMGFQFFRLFFRMTWPCRICGVSLGIFLNLLCGCR